MASVDLLLELVRRYADGSALERVQAAHDLLITACPSQIRLVERGVGAAQILAQLEARVECIIAALLVDIPEEACPQIDIQEQMGEIVVKLVAGVQSMRRFPYLDSQNKRGWSHKEHFELYHAFVASLEDPQWVLIELARQLDDLRHLKTFFPPEQRRIAFEALNIYAPLAHRLGIWRIKWELEDTAFRFTHPEQFHEIVAKLDEQRGSREEGIRQAVTTLQDELTRNGIEAKVTGRPKHIYSIHRKMQRKGVPFEAVYDVRALRVIIGSGDAGNGQEEQAHIETCYHVLGITNSLWTPIPGQFDDYIAKPKSNDYRSLHTAVVDDEGKTIEVQIRTHWMNKAAESGIAAHWHYKERQGSRPGSQKKKDRDVERVIESRVVALRSLLDYSQGQGLEELELAVEEDGVSEPIFVFTPMGDVIRLPAGATPIDFAYRIHTELGNRCYGAKVSGSIVPLNYRLSTGDRVEIITRKRGGPNINWLSLEQGFIKTQAARKKISAWFRRQRREKDIARGHEILDRELGRLGLKSALSFDEVARLLKFKHPEEMLAQIGGGEITSDKVRSVIAAESKPSKAELAREAEEELVTEKDESLTLIEKPVAGDEQAKPGLLVASTKGLYSRLAKCCYPVPPEEIVGYVTRGHGATIHLADCPNVASNKEKWRIVPAGWGQVDQQSYPAMVVVEAANRRGLMGDIGATVAKEQTDINEAKGKRGSRGAVFELLLEVHDAEQLEQVIQKLAQTKGVRKAYRKKG